MSLLKSSVNYVATGKGTLRGKFASKKKRQRNPLQNQLAASAAARDSRAVNRDNQRLAKEVDDLDDRNRGLQKQLAANQPKLRALELRMLRKAKVNEIAALRKLMRKKEKDIKGPLLKKTRDTYKEMEQAREALDEATRKYDESTAKLEQTKKDLKKIPVDIEFAKDDLDALEAEYNQMPASATYKIPFGGNLAVHMQDLSLSNPVAPGGVVQTGWMADKAEKLARRVAGDKNVDEAKKAMSDAMKKAKGKNKVRV